MKVMTSYFYRVRFFDNNMIPLSTAVWDPKWYHEGMGQAHQWRDKRGIWNGIRFELLKPGASCEGLCRGPEYCGEKELQNCHFLQKYRKQLDALDIDEVMYKMGRICEEVWRRELFRGDPTAVLLVHETPDNPCSERRVIQSWFKDNGVDVKEFY